MGVGSVKNSAQTNTSTTIMASAEDTQIQALTEERQNINNQIKELRKNTSKDSADANKELIKQLQQQITEIDSAISDLKTQKVANKTQNKDQDNNVNDASSAASFGAGSDSKVISLDSSLKTLKVQNSVKKSLQDRSAILETQIKIDSGRGASTEKDEKELSKIKASIKKIDNDMSGKSEVKEDKKVTDDKKVAEENKKKVEDETKKAEEKKKDSEEKAETLVGNFVDAKS